MSDIQKEVERVKNQAVDTFNNADVRTRNIVVGVLVALVVAFVLYFTFG